LFEGRARCAQFRQTGPSLGGVTATLSVANGVELSVIPEVTHGFRPLQIVALVKLPTIMLVFM
jgi:hypothetical protein